MSEDNKPSTGTKFDQHKPKVSLIPSEVILGLARVLTMGANKYGELNWTSGIQSRRLIDALYRHLLAYQSGEDKDPESGESHLLHCMANLTFLYYLNNHKPELDNRWEK